MIVALIRRMPAARRFSRAARRVLCVMVFDHYFHLKFEGDRMFLVCEVCEYASAGWSSGHEHYGRRLPGDARRHQSYARRMAPAPLPDDWFEAEHFQGEHARVS